jgi:hypothetical protein
MEPVGVGGKLRNRRDANELISPAIVNEKVALMTVGHPLPFAPEIVSPGEELARQPAARGELPHFL